MPRLLDDVDLLRRLVAFDTVSRNSNLPFADFICEYLDRPGVRIRRNPAADAAKTNLVVLAGPDTDDARNGLVLSGHMDTVPADEPEWTSDPFTVTERNGALVGRGTADMKGFLALAVNAMAGIDPTRLRQPLGLLFTYDEELGTLGAERFAATWTETGWLPRQVIIGEPTSLRAVRMHKGHAKLLLTFRGVSAHSGYPHLGRNAIEPAARAMVALSALRAALEAERPAMARHFPDVPFVALNIGEVHGGAAVNVVPDRCEVGVGLRVLPGMRSGDLIDRVREAVTTAVPGVAFDVTVTGDSPPFLLEEDRPVYRHLSEVLGQRDSLAVHFATDAGWLQTAGYDCVVWGPGTIEVAHRPDESIPLADLREGARLLARVVGDACLRAAP